MPKHYKMKMKARGGAMAQGGMPASGVGSTVGQWVEDWLLGWLGFADGGELHHLPRRNSQSRRCLVSCGVSQ